MKIALLATVASFALCAPAANAAVNIYISDVNGTAVAQAIGSLDLTGLTPIVNAATSIVSVRGTSFFFLGQGSVSENAYSGLTGPSEFGSVLMTGGTGTGTAFGIRLSDGRVYLASDYVSGEAINSTATFLYKTVAAMELNVGTYVYTLGTDHITLHIGEAAPAAVPEPASWALMLCGFGAIGAALRSRRKVAVRFG